MFVDGSFTAGGGGTFQSVNPADESVLTTVALADTADIDTAVAAARRAYETVWRPMPGRERAKYLFRIARLIQERARELAVLESLDNGKPIRESRDVDVPMAAAHFFYYAGWADKLGFAGFGTRPAAARRGRPGGPLELPAADGGVEARSRARGREHRRAEVRRDDAAVGAGPRRHHRAGRPAARRGEHRQRRPAAPAQALVAHPGVDKIAFTGSTAVGKQIAAAVAGTPKRLTLELGGKAANIVFDDAPLEQAVEGIVNGIFFNQGHVCCAGSRLLVQESIAEETLDALRRRLLHLKLGDPLDKNTDIGAINSAEQLKRITELTAIAESEGATRWSPPCELPVDRLLVRARPC